MFEICYENVPDSVLVMQSQTRGCLGLQAGSLGDTHLRVEEEPDRDAEGGEVRDIGRGMKRETMARLISHYAVQPRV